MTLDAMERVCLEANALDAWLSVGIGKEAVPIKGVLALLPLAQADRLPLLQQACQRAGAQLIGAIFPALIDGAALVHEGAWLLGLPQQPVSFLLPDLEQDPQAAGNRLADAARQAMDVLAQRGDSPRGTLLMVFDGQLTRIGSLVEQAYLALDGRLRLMGVNAGSDSFKPMPCLFDAQTVIGNGMLGLLLPDTVMTGLSLQPAQLNELFTVTASVDNRVASINGRPAFDVYRELVARDYGVDLHAGNFYEHAVHFPMAIVRGDRQALYRIPARLEDDGAITCIGEIPRYSLVSVLKAPALADMACTDQLATAMPVSPAGQLLTFYCAGRSLHFGQGCHQELDRLQHLLQPACHAGALVLGEIGNTNSWGYPLFYNGAIAGVGWELRP